MCPNTLFMQWSRTRRFESTFRFIDNLTVLNDGGEFERKLTEIYSPELELKKENDINHEIYFLDLGLKIKFTVRMPYLHNNTASKMFYSAFGAEFWE